MSIAGQWDIAVDTPMGVQKSVLSLATDGQTLSGELLNQFGSTPLKEGLVDGEKLTWILQPMIPMPMTLKFEASVSGDTISGAVTSTLGTSPLTGARKA
ncbi:hypothetical protein [Caulobacter hibisci]|uniref:Uncharacterized protein n=1 Tax=Caulobacter hibisci TaxID=2035993 RepID=A0ABS0SWV2_9CAUL|nr:hypothetical protein [Caulobacter hibisci]MBI1684079.1 hypothetical protein [Caulobacter hibisci]